MASNTASSEDNTIINMLKKQEENWNKRIDSLENKMDKLNMDILYKLSDLDRRVKSVETSAEFISKQYDSQRKTTDYVLKSQANLEKENEDLKKQIKVLENNHEKQKMALNDLEQYGRRDCIEISGVPPSENENCEELTIQVAREMGVEIGAAELVACHRVRKSKGEPIIIAKFLNRKNKEKMMSKRKSLKGKTAGSMKLTTNDNKAGSKIFVNESLTAANKNLYRLARMKTQDSGWKFSWTRNGVVFARKDENAAITKINNLSDIEDKIV
eukprot:gene8540-biopygen6837